jgi:hypothetical protein
MRPRRAILMLGGGAIALGGCYAYVPAELAAVPDAQEVRVLISRAGALRLSDMGAGDLVSLDDPTVEGVLQRSGDGRVRLRIPVRSESLAAGARPIVQERILDPGEIVRIDRRRLDRTRTAFALGGAAGLATATIVLIIGGSEGTIEPPGGGGSDDLRAPLDPVGGTPILAPIPPR